MSVIEIKYVFAIIRCSIYYIYFYRNSMQEFYCDDLLKINIEYIFEISATSRTAEETTTFSYIIVVIISEDKRYLLLPNLYEHPYIFIRLFKVNRTASDKFN